MTKKIFRSMFFVSIITFLTCMFVFIGILYNYYGKLIHTEMRNEAEYIGKGVEGLGINYLVDLKGESRITWIDANGTVLYDSKANYSKMENHGDRIEFIQALEKGAGESKRYSNTLSVITLYYAIKISDGTVIRVSNTQYTVFSLISGMSQMIVLLIIIAIFFSIFLSSKVAKRILRPINEIDISNPYLDENYEEIFPLLSKIKKQNKEINQKIRELKRQQEEFKTITENMNEGFVIVDINTDILSYNTSAINQLGDDTNAEINNIYQLNRSEEIRNVVEKALDGMNSTEVLNRNNKCFQIIGNTVFDKNIIIGMILLIIDITEKEKREKLRREFTSNVSHELKTPLTSIYGMSDLLMQGIVKTEDIKEFGKNIHNESGRLISLVNDILKLSQLDEGIILEEKSKIDLYNITKEIVKSFSNIITEKNIFIELSGEHCEIFGYYSIIEKIIYNLCDNAIKYNNVNGKITIKIKNKVDKHIFTIEDTGVGIEDAEQDRVFERFYRVDKSHSKKIGGTGLGLSIVKHGALIHNAQVVLKSKLNSGTKISVIFME